MKALLFGTTYSIVTKNIGSGGVIHGKEVSRIQQLLRLAGFLRTSLASDGTWDQTTAQAWLDFQKNIMPNQPTVPFVEPRPAYGQWVDRLAVLALKAKVLIPLPTLYRKADAIKWFFDYCRQMKYEYGWEQGSLIKSRTIWGFAGRPKWAIVTADGKAFGLADRYCFPPNNPIYLNCTSFANLMMSIWLSGNAHESPYDASQMVGNDVALGWRYKMKALDDGKMMVDGYCYDIETIKRMTKPDKLYHIASSDDNGNMLHDTVLYNGEVYECNKPPNNPAVFKTRLEVRVNRMLEAKGKGHRVPRIFGEI